MNVYSNPGALTVWDARLERTFAAILGQIPMPVEPEPEPEPEDEE